MQGCMRYLVDPESPILDDFDFSGALCQMHLERKWLSSRAEVVRCARAGVIMRTLFPVRIKEETESSRVPNTVLGECFQHLRVPWFCFDPNPTGSSLPLLEHLLLINFDVQRQAGCEESDRIHLTLLVPIYPPAPAEHINAMPPTPSRSVQRGGARQRQGSSLHPQPGPSASVIAAAGAAPIQTARGGRGAQANDSAAVPFVHPALALSSGVLPSSSSTAGLPPAAAAQIRGRRPFNHRNLFARDLRNLMYAYGDSPNPDPDSVMLMEEMTVDFITDLCCRARPSPYSLGLGTSSISNSSSAFGATLEQVAALQDPNGVTIGADGMAHTLPPRAPHRLRVKLEDFRHALRKDVEAKKLGRMEQLLYADKVVTEARRVGGVEEAAERAGAMQTDNLPPPTSNGDGPSQDANLEDLDDDDDLDGGKTGKSGKAKSKGGAGGKGGAKGKGKPKGGAAVSRAGSARSSVQPS